MKKDKKLNKTELFVIPALAVLLVLVIVFLGKSNDKVVDTNPKTQLETAQEASKERTATSPLVDSTPLVERNNTEFNAPAVTVGLEENQVVSNNQVQVGGPVQDAALDNGQKEPGHILCNEENNYKDCNYCDHRCNEYWYMSTGVMPDYIKYVDSHNGSIIPIGE